MHFWIKENGCSKTGNRIYFKKFIGSDEFINGKNRWCLWLVDVKPQDLKQMPSVISRIDNIRKLRLASTDKQARFLADYPTTFRDKHNPESAIIVPLVSSENRKYVPFGFIDKDTIPSNLCSFISNATLYHFGILTSEMHMTWVRYVCGRLKSDYRYSNTIVYNNYPFPENISDKQKQKVETAAQIVLDTRTKYPDSSLADLYDPRTMPPNLVKAHKTLDKAVDLCYRPQAFINELNRIEFLFSLYEALNAPLLKPARKKKPSQVAYTEPQSS